MSSIRIPSRGLPKAFLGRMAEMLGDELPAFLDALDRPGDGLRVNTLRVSPAEFERLNRRDECQRWPLELEQMAYLAEGFLLAGDESAGKHPYHAAGLYYLQDPSAMVVGALVDPQPGERVLDLAAAPGGKATHLAARMRNAGLLVANDISYRRALTLTSNLERCGVRNALVTSESAEHLARRFGGYFDRVLLDAPCSGESMFHKSAAALSEWSESAVAGCARRQLDLLRLAGRLVRPGGLLAYSTCTFSSEENENVIEAFVAATSEFEPARLAPVPGAEPLRRAHPTGRSSNAVSLPAGREPTAYRFWPHRVPGAGHFVAAFRRTADQGALVGEAEPAAGSTSPRRERQAEGLTLYEGFLRATYPGLRVRPGRMLSWGDELYELPEGIPSLRGLKVVRAGLKLGSIQRGRFEPAHALALAASPDEAPGRVDLELDDTRVEAYLAGHPIEAPGDPGWLPVTVDGFALGWGKRVATTVKNHYPKGLRWRGWGG